jgi:hypothetical protein
VGLGVSAAIETGKDPDGVATVPSTDSSERVCVEARSVEVRSLASTVIPVPDSSARLAGLVAINSCPALSSGAAKPLDDAVSPDDAKRFDCNVFVDGIELEVCPGTTVDKASFDLRVVRLGSAPASPETGSKGKSLLRLQASKPILRINPATKITTNSFPIFWLSFKIITPCITYTNPQTLKDYGFST